MCSFQHDLITREFEVRVKQRDSEAFKLSVPLQHIPDLGKAVCVPIVDGLDDVNVLEFRPLHWRDCQFFHGQSPSFANAHSRPGGTRSVAQRCL
jgi:hypothetical protein